MDAFRHASTRLNQDSKAREPVLGGHSATLYSQNNDLVLLKHHEEEDRSSAFVQRYLPVFFLVRTQTLDGCLTAANLSCGQSRQRDDNMAYIPEKRIARFVTIISIKSL